MTMDNGRAGRPTGLSQAEPSSTVSALTGFDSSRKLRVLSLFAGIGGFDLGLERTGGFETVAFCEIDPFCRRVLARHWPEVACHDDIRSLSARQLIASGISPNAIVAGFPCQDISTAGLGAGLAGERSGLFFEIVRLIREFAALGRPIELLLLENVSALLGRGLGDVLGALASVGLDAEWHCIPASAVGAPHQRDRIWIVAYPNQDRLQEREHVARPGGEAPGVIYPRGSTNRVSASKGAANANERELALGGSLGRMGRLYQSLSRHRDWPLTAEPVLGRGADGLPNRVDRCGALGNAVVPQIPELIGRAILASIEAERLAA